MQIKLNAEKVKSLLKNQELYADFYEFSNKIYANVTANDVCFSFSKLIKKCKCSCNEYDGLEHNKKCPNSTESLELNQNLTIDHIHRKGFEFDYVEMNTYYFKDLINLSTNLLKFSLKNENYDFSVLKEMDSIADIAKEIKFHSDLLDLIKIYSDWPSLIKKQNSEQSKKSNRKSFKK